MPVEIEKQVDKRIILRVPVYMPELREELAKYPENYRAKRLLQLAAIGMLVNDGRMPTGGTQASALPPPLLANEETLSGPQGGTAIQELQVPKIPSPSNQGDSIILASANDGIATDREESYLVDGDVKPQPRRRTSSKLKVD